MKIVNPGISHETALRKLWKDAFGDDDAFLDLFFARGFSPDRCRCVMAQEKVAAALYWFDISCSGRKMAYLYAVATDPRFRGRGNCRALMADTHRHLADLGYCAALLVPQDEALRTMYRKMGYLEGPRIREFTAMAARGSVAVSPLPAAEYAALRAKLLPEDAVIQEGANLNFLSGLAQFYGGPEWLAAVHRDGEILRCLEFLGDPGIAPGLVAALDCREGHFRTPGDTGPFAQYFPLEANAPIPSHFGFPFD